MTIATFYAVVGVVLFVMGLFALFNHRNLLRQVIAVNVMGGGVFMILIATANRVPGNSPDPVPHAMVLTGIVVAVSATTLALAIASHWYRISGKSHIADEDTPD